MKPAAFLLNVAPQETATQRACADLQRLLDPYFGTTVVESQIKVLPHELEPLTERIQPRVVFLILSNDQTAEGNEAITYLVQKGNAPVIAVVEECEPELIFQLLKLGASDFVATPLKASELLPRVWKLAGQPFDSELAARTLKVEPGLQRLIGESAVFLNEVKKIPSVARCDVNVLIAGETGTGKELYARAIHYCGPRAGGPFIAVNCGAIPGDLVENELFGHERGAFTSALALQRGLIEEANGGTLFLDEIDCLPIFSQVKLLRFLQEKEYRPLGSSKMRRADVRVIAASNLNLEEAVGQGKLRQDLFYRLNIISLTLPPLRERGEDIPILARHFLEKYSREFEKKMPELSADALRLLMVYPWPGNVRELEHVIERAMVLCDNDVIDDTDLVISANQKNRVESLQEAKAKEIARFEKNYIQGLLSACRGNITRAAQVAQKNRRAFFQLIQKHHIDVARFRSEAL